MVCIINNTDISKLYTEFTPEVVFINETAKITESDTVIALTHYASASLVMIDNHKQLKLTVLNQCDLSQQFITQITMLLFTRLLQLDHLSIMFTEQHQMSSEISYIESKIFYNSQLINVSDTDLHNCSQADKIKTAIKEKFEKKSLMLMLDIKNIQTQISNSRYNMINVSVCINLIKTLLKMFESDKIAIISSY